jgi:hypothetical protein
MMPATHVTASSSTVTKQKARKELAALVREFDEQKSRGALAVAFEAKLSKWRVEIARSILRYGKLRDAEIISGAAQRILDRIIFLRLCEELGLEEHGTLNDMANDEDGFWPLFMEAHEKRYRTIYDGLLFPSRFEDDPSGVEKHIRDWRLKGRVFQQVIRGLYFPQPYRFDVVPLELLGGIYERSLGKRLRVVGNDVQDEFKPEYQRSKGAIYTQPWVVHRVIARTLEPITKGLGPEQIFDLRILDPACGSGNFLLGVYEHLEEAILEWARSNPGEARRSDFLRPEGQDFVLSVEGSRKIIRNCLHGVDIDPNAVEVTRMSLALRHLDRVAGDLPDEPKNLLAGIGRNIRQGNALVGPDIAKTEIAPDSARMTMPFSWNDRLLGFGNVMEKGGFHAVVGNPPYIEVKRCREWMPAMYAYLKDHGGYVTTDQGKTDIAMPFMEKGVKLLRPGGRLGFIIQNRFFKTEYGATTRRWLRKNKLLESIEDFRDIQVFAGRTTYTTILVLKAGTESFEYRTYEGLVQAQMNRPCLKVRTKTDLLDDDPWSLDQPDLLEVHNALAKKHGTIKRHGELAISVGLQTLYGKIYQLQADKVTSQTVRGTNGFGTQVVLERKALRPLCRNRGCYPFRADNADAWVIFPYEVRDGAAEEIRWHEFDERFPKTAAYLESSRATLNKAVAMEDGVDRWHLYTRPQNLAQQARPKVLFPSTIEDVVAAVDPVGEVYQDNVRMNSLSAGASGLDLMAVAAVMNSSLFNALAKAKAGLSDGGWRQFNRQFAELVPFPMKALQKKDCSTRLADLSARIMEQQDQLRKPDGEGKTSAIRETLSRLWMDLDESVESLYGLTAEQKKVIACYPRRVDRVELVLRVAGEDPGDDEDMQG